ncbi:MAG: hypothetical protein VB048_00260 [Bacteroidaceae bacterium]|nr:hypothetical protein [Bacteroidaceae bacterium]MEA5100686.1 hypothetical protein [Bacteroidales bacterium]
MKEKRRIKGCFQFRMLKILVFFIAVQICTNQVMSQIVSQFDLEAVAYSVEDNDISFMHSQKILQYKENEHIVLTLKDSVNHQARFYLIERNDYNIKYVDIPIEYNVKDFSILGDTLYFCGKHQIENETLTSGFIAYIKIYDMFNGLTNNCYYSDIKSVLVVNRIKTYHNSNNDRMVVGIGEQYYGDIVCTPPHDHGYDPLPPFGEGKKENIINRKILGITEELYTCNDDPKKNWDCFIDYKIVEIPTSNEYNNIYDIYRCYFQTPYMYSTNPSELLRDIILTDDYICLVSNYYPNIPGTCDPQNIFIIRRIDKNNFNNQVTNRCDATPFTGTWLHDFNFMKLEHLTGNDIAFCYSTQSPSGLFSNAIYKINLNNNPFTTLLSSMIDENSLIRPRLWDLEYLKESNQLLILKEQSTTNPIYEDYVYYVNMDNQTTFPYTTLAFKVPYNTYQNIPIYWNSLLKYNSDHFALGGNIENKGLIIFEKDAYKFFYEGDGCSKMNLPIVKMLPNPSMIIESWNLVQCKFLYWKN